MAESGHPQRPAALVLGDFSGRNLGHNALAVAIVAQLAANAGCRSLLPTLDPNRLRRVLAGMSDAEVIDARPWRGNLKFFGLAIEAAFRRSDCIVLADNPFYDARLYHPFHNGLVALTWLTGRARKLGKPVICLNSGAGPLSTARGRKLAATICARASAVQARDLATRARIAAFSPQCPLKLTADSAFAFPWERWPHSGNAAQRNVYAINLSPEFFAAGDNGETRAAARRLARAVAKQAAHNGGSVLAVAAHRRDLPLAELVAATAGELVSSQVQRAWESDWVTIAAQREVLACFVSTRYHELVLYAGGGVPVVGLDCGEKVPELMQELGEHAAALSCAALGTDGAELAIKTAIAAATDNVDHIRLRCAELAERARSGSRAVLDLIPA